MQTDKPQGIASALLAILNDKEKAKLIEEQLALFSEAGALAIATQKAKTARAAGRSKSKWPKKSIAAEEFIRLTRSGKKISAQHLFDSLVNRRPEQKWNYNTIRDWHKLMLAGVKDAPNESSQVV